MRCFRDVAEGPQTGRPKAEKHCRAVIVMLPLVGTLDALRSVTTMAYPLHDTIISESKGLGRAEDTTPMNLASKMSPNRVLLGLRGFSVSVAP